MPEGRLAELRSPPMPKPGAGPGQSCAGDREAYYSEIDEAKIIKAYVPLVKRLATHVKGRLPEVVQLDDLIQAGLITVLRMARHADHLRNGDATLRRSIMNAMIDEARREAWAPVRTLRLAKAAGRAMRAIKRRTGRDASDEEIAAELGVPPAQYQQMLVEVAGIRLLPLDELDEGGEQPLQARDNQEEELHEARVTSALTQSIASLPERERLVVSLYYEHELSMEEVGEVLGLNKSTVCRTHGRALLMLRNALFDWRAAAIAPQPEPGE